LTIFLLVFLVNGNESHFNNQLFFLLHDYHFVSKAGEYTIAHSQKRLNPRLSDLTSRETKCSTCVTTSVLQICL